MVVARYFEASNRQDVAAAMACLTRDATVDDPLGQSFGLRSVRRWFTRTSRLYRPMFVVLRRIGTPADLGLAVSVSGTFPGSPAELGFHFRFRDGKISGLTIE